VHKVRLIISGIEINPGFEESYRNLQVPPTIATFNTYLEFTVKWSRMEWNLVDTDWFWLKTHSLMCIIKADVSFVVGIGSLVLIATKCMYIPFQMWSQGCRA
jgi:hypothetical protein